MDRFVKVMLVASTLGAVGAAGMNFQRKEVPLAEDRQEYELAKAWAEPVYTEDEYFCYGGVFSHLEKEKSFLGWSDSTGNYIADIYYTGDHYYDPRIMIVHAEDSGEVVQVLLTASYSKRGEQKK